jgi:hypothetical protein
VVGDVSVTSVVEPAFSTIVSSFNRNSRRLQETVFKTAGFAGRDFKYLKACIF